MLIVFLEDERILMRYFQIHLKDPVGNRLDYWTGEKKLKQLIEKYDIVIDYLKKAGFEQIGADVSPSLQNAPQSTTVGQASFCELHKIEMKERQGKYGKFYSHAKELDGTWVYCTGKGWGIK